MFRRNEFNLFKDNDGDRLKASQGEILAIENNLTEMELIEQASTPLMKGLAEEYTEFVGGGEKMKQEMLRHLYELLVEFRI